MRPGLCSEMGFQGGVRSAQIIVIGGDVIRSTFPFASDCEQLNAFVIQSNIDLLLIGDPDNDSQKVSLQTNSNEVFTIHREIVIDGDPSTSSGRKVVTHAFVLLERFRDVDLLQSRRNS